METTHGSTQHYTNTTRARASTRACASMRGRRPDFCHWRTRRYHIPGSDHECPYRLSRGTEQGHGPKPIALSYQAANIFEETRDLLTSHTKLLPKGGAARAPDPGVNPQYCTIQRSRPTGDRTKARVPLHLTLTSQAPPATMCSPFDMTEHTFSPPHPSHGTMMVTA